MFENVLGHNQIVDQLSHAVRSETLPATMLFAGPTYSGKLTTALELARGLTCERNGAWSCRCNQCAQQRALLHPETLLIGNRSFLPELYLARSALLRRPQPATLFLFMRSIRKFTRRFDPILWEGEEQRVAKSTAVLDEAEEILRGLDPEDVVTTDLAERTGRLVELVESGVQRAPADLSPIAVVRNMAFWARVAPAGRAKVAVIEGAESLNDAARNAMLKILEEPPPAVYFVLVAERRQAVIDTIRSRARSFSFTERDVETQKSVITRIFRDPDVDSRSLRDYVLSNGGTHTRTEDAGARRDPTVAELAREAAKILLRPPGWERYQSLQDLVRRTEETIGREGYRGFFEELLQYAAEHRADAVDPDHIEAVQRRRGIGDLIAEATHRTEVLNMSLLNVVEDLVYKLDHHAEVH